MMNNIKIDIRYKQYQEKILRQLSKIKKINREIERDREAHNNVIVLFRKLQFKEWKRHHKLGYKFCYIITELGQQPFEHITNMSYPCLSNGTMLIRTLYPGI